MQKPKFKILSIDGGGIRGVIPCVILDFFEQQLSKPLSQVFDLMAGTSTGGIISLGLAKPEQPFSAQEMLELYQKKGEEIFAKRQQSFWTWLAKGIRIPYLFKLSDYVHRPYDATGIEAILREYFEDKTLRNTATDVFVPTHDIESGRPFYFSTRLAKAHEKENYRLSEVARATSAAPTYFEPTINQYDNEQETAFIDGGVFANNPALLAYCEAKEIWKRKAALAFDPEVLADDKDYPFFMLSIGTGKIPKKIDGRNAQDWSSIGWLSPLLQDIFMNSVAESTDYAMQHLLPNYTNGTTRYERLQVIVPKENGAMDDASSENIEKLIEIANRFVKQYESRLLAICDRLS